MSGLMVGGLLNWRLLYMQAARVWAACETRSAGHNSKRVRSGVGFERETENRTLCACAPNTHTHT